MLNFKSLLKLILLVQLANLVQSKKCGFWINLKSSNECKEYMYEESRYEMPENATVRDVYYLDGLCQEAVTCLSRYECDEVQHEINRINTACDFALYQQPALLDCLTGFFKNAYVAELTDDDTSCFWKHSILDNMPARDFEEFFNRKECFMSYVQSSCTWEAQEYFSTYPGSYKRFARYMTTRVANKICTGPQSLLNSIHCSALIEEFQSWSWETDSENDSETESEIINTAQLKKICRDIEKCVPTSCMENETDDVDMICKEIKKPKKQNKTKPQQK